MKKQKKFIILILLLLAIILSPNCNVLANNNSNSFQKVEYSDEFKDWLELSDEEKNKVMQPTMYDIIYTTPTSTNPIYKARMLGARANSQYNLRDIIPENTVIKNQGSTYSCWTFAGLSSLETNLALANYKKGLNTSKVYDFSERHMEYSTSRTFASGVINEKGYNRRVGSGGNWYFAQSYLTNGIGAISEEDMPFKNSESQINISEIQNKTVISQVYDTIEFADYNSQTDDAKEEIMNQIKEHIQNYGSVFASVHGNSASQSGFSCYNNKTGAKYCNNSTSHKIDHAVSIIGWDDNYDLNNFENNSRPSQNGAWIIRNSWGEKIEYNLSQLKQSVFNAQRNECIANGWNTPAEIPNTVLIANGYTIEGDKAYLSIGDDGLMYVSYEDANIANGLWGIVKAKDKISYENIYQYDEYYPAWNIGITNSNMMLCTIFDKKTSGTEYITQVSLYAPETYNCRVYVNPNGTSKSKNDMQSVMLETGISKTINAGYHTLEFAEPVEITGEEN